MVETVGAAEVEIRATLAELKRDLADARGELQKFSRNSTRDLGQFDKSMRAATGRLKTFTAAMAGVAAGVATFQTLRVGAQFEQQMSGVLAITQANEREFKELNRLARDLGASTAFSAKDAADGMEFLARAGFKTNEIVAALPGTLSLAAAGALELGRAADISSNVLRGFNLAVEESDRVADVLAAAASKSNTNVEQLGEALKFVAPVAAGLNVSLELTTAAIGRLSDAGLQGSNAGTGLRRVLSELASPSEDLRKIMGGLSLETDGFEKVMMKLAESGISTGQALEIFGERGGPAFSVLVQQFRELDKDGVNGLAKLRRELELSTGFADRTAKTRMDNLAGSLEELSGAFEELQLVAGETGALNAFREVIDELTDVLRSDAARQFAQDLGSGLAASVNFLREIVSLLGTIGNLAAEIGAIGASDSVPGTTGGRRFRNGLPADIGTAAQDLFGVTLMKQAGAKLNRRAEDRRAAREAEKAAEQSRQDLINRVQEVIADPEKLSQQLPFIKELIEKYDFLREAGVSILRDGPDIAGAVEDVGKAAEDTAPKVATLTEAEKRLQAQRDRAQSQLMEEVAGLQQIAEEYLSGAIALKDLDNEMEVNATLSKLQLSLDDAQGQAIARLTRERQKYNQAIAVKRSSDELQQDIDVVRRLSDMYRDAALSARQLATEEEILRRVQALGIDMNSAEAQQIAAQVRERDMLTNSLDREISVRNSLIDARARTVELQDEIRFYGAAAGAAEAYRLEQDLLNQTLMEFGEITPDQANEIRQVAQAYGDAVNQLARFRETTAFFEQNLGRAFSDLILDGESLTSVFYNLTRAIAEAALQATLFGQGPLAQVFGGGPGIIGGLLGGLFHAGGTVGQSGARRTVAPGTFIGAPRLHNGLRPDEFPAILQKGEEVIPKGGRRGGGQQIVVNMNISTPNADSFRRDQGQIMARTAAALERASRRNN